MLFDKVKAGLVSSGLFAAVLGAVIGLEPQVQQFVSGLPLGSFWVALATVAIGQGFAWLKTERTGYGGGVTTDVDG